MVVGSVAPSDMEAVYPRPDKGNTLNKLMSRRFSVQDLACYRTKRVARLNYS